MDDIVILAPTRWKLRRAIKTVNATLAELKRQKHPKKTFIGKVQRGFDFLGYTITTSGLDIAPNTWERFVERVTRLYEQGAGSSRIGDYVRHWWRWVKAGVSLRVERSSRPGRHISFESHEFLIRPILASKTTILGLIRGSSLRLTFDVF